MRELRRRSLTEEGFLVRSDALPLALFDCEGRGDESSEACCADERVGHRTASFLSGRSTLAEQADISAFAIVAPLDIIAKPFNLLCDLIEVVSEVKDFTLLCPGVERISVVTIAIALLV